MRYTRIVAWLSTVGALVLATDYVPLNEFELKDFGENIKFDSKNGANGNV